MRKIFKNIPILFKPDPWKVVETDWSEDNNKNNETIFTVANGYLGVRGFMEEGFYGRPDYTDSTTMINGVYEYFKYNHIWQRPGFPGKYHAIINQCNPFSVKVIVDGELIGMNPAITDYARTLDLKTGNLTRTFCMRTAGGKTVTIAFERFASQENKHLLAGRIICSVDKEANVQILSTLTRAYSAGSTKAEIGGASKDNIFHFLSAERTEQTMFVNYETIISQFSIACAVSDRVNIPAFITTQDQGELLQTTYNLTVKPQEKVVYERTVAYATQRDYANFCNETKKMAIASLTEGYEGLLKKSASVLAAFWDKTDIEIDKDDLVQQGIRFSIFQIFQSTGKDEITNISANGLSGTGYSGHTFWDTEVFMMPMYIYTNPDIARKLIMYRYNILDKARERAKQMDDQGALFAWNSINGEECGHVFEAVTAQYHIDNDIFYAIYRYFEATNDEEFLLKYCAEILFEISKCMAHRGSFIPLKGNRFCINVVCGPDEYNPIVDNNMYTNLLTQKQLYFTLKVADLLQTKYPVKYQELLSKCRVDDQEIALWKKAADQMYIPYSKELGMYMQDDNFIYKDPIDIESIPKENLPLLTHLHPLNLWRYQVCKQADIVLLTFICSDYFSEKERKDIFDYYEPKTIHDSSLSASIHSIVSCDIGYHNEAYDYLKQASRMDLDNVNRNTFFGLHAACMGASWMMLVNGYAGLRVFDNILHFKPFICPTWNKFTFKLFFKSSRLEVKVEKENTTYTILSGAPMEIEHYGKRFVVELSVTLANGREEQA